MVGKNFNNENLGEFGFFHNGFLGGHTLPLQLGCFGLDYFIISVYY